MCTSYVIPFMPTHLIKSLLLCFSVSILTSLNLLHSERSFGHSECKGLKASFHKENFIVFIVYIEIVCNISAFTAPVSLPSISCDEDKTISI